MDAKPRLPLAVSMGDPAGIGPEVLAKAWAALSQERDAPVFFAIGSTATFAGLCPVQNIASPDDAAAVFSSAMPILPAPCDDAAIAIGTPNEASARAARAALDLAIKCACNGAASGLVTAPVSKANLYTIGFDTPGQTEYVSRAAGCTDDEGIMMLAGPTLRVVPMTVHIPYADVPAALTDVLINRAVRSTAAALRRDFGIASPRLAMAGLNPHAGESGTIGREEIDLFTPVLNRLRADGIAIDGPLPADSLFHSAARARYDAVLCPTHDQALIPIKALHFDDAVNVTLGLPIIRTSPDHGTAFDIAGKGVANPASTIAAIRMAAQIAANRAA
jgi:4-hydroxythreonine-4-phosphate dehydrogenase